MVDGITQFKGRLVEILKKSKAPGWYTGGLIRWKTVNMALASRYEAELRSALVEAGAGEENIEFMPTG